MFSTAAQERSLEERVYPSRRFDVLGLVQRRRRGGPSGQRDSGAPGLGVYSAWLGGLPGFLSGARLPARASLWGLASGVWLGSATAARPAWAWTPHGWAGCRAFCRARPCLRI